MERYSVPSTVDRGDLTLSCEIPTPLLHVPPALVLLLPSVKPRSPLRTGSVHVPQLMWPRGSHRERMETIAPDVRTVPLGSR